MKKLAAIFLTLLFASTASAQVISNPTTNARMDGMGVNNWQIEDDFNIFINPAQLSNYKNAVYGELGTDPCAVPGGGCGSATTSSGANERNLAAFGGLNLDASYGGWGVYLGRPYSLTGPLTGMAVAPADIPSANRFDLFYSTHGMPLGFYLSYASASTETTPAVGTKATVDASEINVGVGGLVMNGMLDAALNIGLPSYENKDSAIAGKIEGDAAVNLALLVRHHASVGGGKLLTTFQFISGDMSTKTTPTAGASSKVDATLTTISLDTALNSKPAEGTLLVAGIGITSTGTETKVTGAKTTTDSMSIPVNVGVENQTFKKVKTRVGLTKAIYSTTECKDSTGAFGTCTGGAVKASTVADGFATVSMGLGWAVSDNLMLDAVINQDVLFTGSYVVSGIPETVSSKLSATYRFK